MRILLLALAFSAAAWPQADPQRASLEGTVVDEITGAPIPRALVYVMAGNRAPAQPGAPTPAPQGVTAYTDAAGRFRFDNVQPGTHSVMARRNGFVEPFTSGRPALQVQLEAGQPKTGVVLKLLPQAVIAGRVLDEFGDPVQGVQVQALTRLTQRGKDTWGNARAFITTNDRGEFRLIGLAPGRYVIAAQYNDPARLYPGAIGPRADLYAATYFPKSLEPDTAQPVEAAAGRVVSSTDIVLQKDVTFRVRGKVIGRNGEVPAGFGVQARSADRPAQFGMTGTAMRSGTDGSFEIQGLRRGSFVLVAQVQEPGSSTPSLGSAPVTVKDQDVEGVVIRITGGIPVNGTLAFEGASQKPDWKMFQLMLAPPEGIAYSSMQQGRPREDGSFSLVASLPGKYNLMVNGPTPPGVYLASVRLGGAELLGRELDLSAPLSAPLQVTYRADGGRLHCKVEIPAGAPASTSRGLLLIPQQPELRVRPFLRFTPLPIPEAVVGGLRPGPWLAVAVDNTDYNTIMQSDIPQALLDAAVPLQVDPNGQHELTLKLVPMPAR